MDWLRFRAQIGRKLSDPDHRKYQPDLLVDCVNDALQNFASSHTGVPREFLITGNGDNSQFPLPEDLVEEEGAGVYAVKWNTDSSWLKEEVYWPGSAWASTRVTSTSQPLKYVLWPVNSITLTRVPKDGQRITIYYVGHYDDIVDDQSLITVPKWAREAIKMYTCAVALDPVSAKAANLGQFKSKREAGHPEHNPLLQQAKYWLARYHELLLQHATPTYSLLQPPAGGRS